MKVHAIYGKDGAIVSLGLAAHGDDEDFNVPRFGPGAYGDQQAAEIEVPDEFRHLPLHEIHARLTVDARGTKARLIARK